MNEGDIEIIKIDDTHQEVRIKIETGIVTLKVKNGTSIYAEDGKPAIEHDGMSIFTNEHGTVHRNDGAAVIDEKTKLEKYFLNAKGFSKDEYFDQPEVLNSRKKQINLKNDD